jgi:predicted amidohydrolase YtcJ
MGAIAEAVLIRDGRIVAVGADDDIRALLRHGEEVIDLAGRVVIPGLIDAHSHVEVATVAHQCWIDARAVPKDEALRRIAVGVLSAPPGSWIPVQGTFGQEFPTRAELDALAPAHRVVFRANAHKLIANTAALEGADIREGDAPPRGTWYDYDGGRMTGVVWEGSSLFPIPWPDERELETILEREISEHFVRNGVTTIYELPGTDRGVAAYQSLAASGRLPVRMSLTFTVAPGLSPILASAQELTRTGIRTGFGTDRLWVGGIKIFLDGDGPATYSSRHHHLSPSRWGLLTRDLNELRGILVDAYRHRTQVWIHAGGDLIQQMVIDTVEEALALEPWPDHRTRIEHLGNPDFDHALIPRLVANGSIPVPNAAFIYGDVPKDASYAFRSFIDAGLQPPGTSDTAGAQLWSMNPWNIIQLSVERANKDGVLIEPAEAITVEEAIRSYTVFSAYAGYREDQLGTIEAGKAGDLAVLASDPFSAPTSELKHTRTVLTVLGGDITWSSDDL